MLSPAEYRAIAKSAFEMADDYRRAAEENPNQRAHLLRLAGDREEHAWFYLDRADIDEDFARRHPQKQEDNRHVA